ncbi:MAG TPA: DUF721 domain-containing protein, partial [Kiritimatiellia bacterium]|nr:DUF721 domain-containing protein [Kiritimatiellia bacterium]
ELDRERFRIADPAPPLPDAEAAPLGTIVDGVLRGMKLGAHVHMTKITDAWPDIVGPQIARHTRPAHLENRVLTVFVAHPAWLMELRGAPAAEILSRLQDRTGKQIVASIRWSIDPGQAPS